MDKDAMNKEVDLIENKLKDYRKVANESYVIYLESYIKFLNKITERSENITNLKESYFCPAIKDLYDLVTREIYPFIIDTKGILYNELSNRMNYYQNMLKGEKLKKLFEDLHENIRTLYSLINKNVILERNNVNDFQFFGYYLRAIEGLNIDYSPENKINHYKELLEIIEDKANFHSLCFYKTCEECYDERNIVEEYDPLNLLNIKNVIEQYHALLIPFDEKFIARHPLLIINKSKYQDIKSKYIANLEKLENILTPQDFDSKKLYSFYNFGKLVDCHYMQINYSFNLDDEYACKCEECFASVVPVLDELIQYFKNPKGLKLTEKEREILELILKSYSNEMIADELIIAENTVSQHINSIIKKADAKGLKVKSSKDLLRIFS